MDKVNIPRRIIRYSTKKNLVDFESKLNKLNATELISEAINTPKNHDNSLLKMKNAMFFEDLENNAKTNYLEFLTDKKKDEMEKNFIKKINKFKIDTNLIINKKDIQTKEYKDKYNSIYEQNRILKEKLINYNNIFLSLQNEIKKKDEEIIKLRQKLELFKDNEKLISSFYENFHEKDPLDIMKSYRKKHETEIELIEENNDLILTIKNLKKRFNEENDLNLKNIKNLKEKINELIIEKNELIKNQNDKKYELNALNKKNKKLEENNNLLHNMLYQIYNKLIEAFKLEKNLNLNEKYLNIKPEDFTPNIFDDKEISQYIKIMIASAKPSLADQLLRETVASANMILRMFLRNKINLNLRFNPALTFKELKIFIEKKEDKIKNLEGLVKKYKNFGGGEPRPLEKNCENFSKTIEEEKNNKNILIKSFNKSNSLLIKRTNLNNRKIIINIPTEEDKSPNNKMKLNYNLTNPKQVTFNSIPKIISEKNIHNTTPYSPNKINLRPKSSSPNINMYKYHPSKINYKDPKYQLLNGFFIKNRNITREHGSQVFINSVQDMKRFINHTNRLFLYRSRLLSDKKYSLSYNKKLKNKIKIFPKEKRKEFKNIIIGKINKMINEMEKTNDKKNLI